MSFYFSRRRFTKAAAGWLLAMAAYLAGAGSLHAITFSFDYDEEDQPAFDPNGTKLKAIVTAAGQIWSDILGGAIGFDHNNNPITNYHFDLRWEDIDGDTLGQHQPGWIFDSRDLVFDTRDPDGNLRNWFFDPTPHDNSEFLMQQTLVRDLGPVKADAIFSGGPPLLLETGFTGNAVASEAIGKFDLLTAVLHEMGHMMGFNWNPNDGDYDFAPSTIGGRSVGVEEKAGMHGGDVKSLMNSTMADSIRKLPSATDILALHDESPHLTFDVPRQDFLGEHSTDWQDTLNWIGGAVPDGDNQVFVRHGGSALMSANGTARTLNIRDASQVHLNNHSLRVFVETTIGDGASSTGQLHIGTLLPGSARFETDRMDLRNGIVNLQNADAVLDVNDNFDIQSPGMLMGAGRTEVGGRLTNNGEISGGAFLLLGFGGTLELATTGAGRLDLDGDGPFEGGRILAVNGNLRVTGPLADDFNGTATVGPGRTLSFHQAWTNHGTLALRGGQTPSNAATLAGPGLMTFDGIINVDGAGVIGAPLVLNGPSRVQIPDSNDQITLGGPTTIRGGAFEGAGSLAIAGVTKVHLPNPLLPENPPTENSTSFRLVGGRLGGVIGPVADVVFDPGTGNPDGVDTTFSTTYSFPTPVTVKTGGTLLAYGSSIHLPRTTTLAGGRIGGLHAVNQVGDLVVEQSSVINPTAYLWGMDAAAHKTTIRFGARLDLTPERIARSGEENVYRGELKLETGSQLHVDLADAESWRFDGRMALDPGAKVSGDILVNTGDVRGNGQFLVRRFENLGIIAPGSNFGGMSMPWATFVQMPGGVLETALSDPRVGSDSGLLTAGAVELDGTLALSLAGGFVPVVGTIIDVVRAPSISGVFADLSLNGPLASMFTGELLYEPTRVAFRITDSLSTADFNRDGVVDGADLRQWEVAMESGDAKAPNQNADATGDGLIDGADFLAWQRQVSHGGLTLPFVGRSRTAAVPEPATFVLALAACGGVLVCRRRGA